ncbi:hypothetical protein ABZU76_14355 [Amycolatopsis sp. NPDC005232]|uniref:hypothetical protein n=1 Tax=Amycolatopsis sp. NPDC005232 TaxID=3157027 RepID=UPI0033B4D03B
MPVIRFHLDSALTPAAALAVLTDFGPARAEHWPSIDAEHFEVHALGATWAEVTEGTSAAWERARYEWDAASVTATTLDSKLFGPGGGWVFRLQPAGEGTRVDVELTRTPSTPKGKILATLLRVVGPPSLRKSFSGPLQAR